VRLLRRARNDLRALWGHLGLKVGLTVPADGGLDWELVVLDASKASVLSSARLRRGDRILRVEEVAELRAMIARLAALDSDGGDKPQVVELEVDLRTLAEAAAAAESATPLRCQGLDLSDWEEDHLPHLPSYEESQSLDHLAGASESRERIMMTRLRRVIRSLRESEIQVLLDKLILQGEPLVGSVDHSNGALVSEVERLSRSLLRAAGLQEDSMQHGEETEPAGGKQLWRALVNGRGVAEQAGAAEDLPVPLISLWSEALYRLGVEALELRREELQSYTEMWSTRIIESEHHQQLDEIDETMGWAALQVDRLKAKAQQTLLLRRVDAEDRSLSLLSSRTQEWKVGPSPLSLRWAMLKQPVLKQARDVARLRAARPRVKEAKLHPELLKPSPGQLLGFQQWMQSSAGQEVVERYRGRR